MMEKVRLLEKLVIIVKDEIRYVDGKNKWQIERKNSICVVNKGLK